MSMTPAELDAFLDQTFPTPLGVVATVREDGSPQVTPVWFRWHDGHISIWTAAQRRWVRNLTRDQRVAFVVHGDDPPYPAVVMRGRATVATGDGPKIDQEIRAITSRYVATDEVDGYIADWPGIRSIVTLHPEHVTSWGDAGPETFAALGGSR
jgi:PPOX class probable F420-dependent enzyme